MRLTVQSNIWTDLWFQLKINNVTEKEESSLVREEKERERIDDRRRRTGVRDKDFWVEKRGEKKLSALTDSGVEREVPAKVKRASALRGERENEEEERKLHGVPFFLWPMHLRGSLHPVYFPLPCLLFFPLSSSFPHSLALQYNLWSTPDLESYLYDICVHYLAQGVQGTGISSKDESRRFEE